MEMNGLLDDKLIRRYLLGELSGKELDDIEKQLFLNADSLDELLAAEDELIDLYLLGKLSAEQKKLFESNFLVSNSRRERLALARSVMDRFLPAEQPVAEGRTQSSRATAILLGSAAAILVLLAGWVIHQNVRIREELSRSRDDYAQLQQKEAERASQLEKDLEQERRLRAAVERDLAQLKAKPPSTAFFALSPGPGRFKDLARGLNSTANLKIPTDAQFVQLQLRLDPDVPYVVYRAILTRREGNTDKLVLRRNRIVASSIATGKMIGVSVATRLLSPGSFVLVLQGQTVAGDFENAATYDFNIPKE
jgi:hypothetical protein